MYRWKLVILEILCDECPINGGKPRIILRCDSCWKCMCRHKWNWILYMSTRIRNVVRVKYLLYEVTSWSPITMENVQVKVGDFGDSTWWVPHPWCVARILRCDSCFVLGSVGEYTCQHKWNWISYMSTRLRNVVRVDYMLHEVTSWSPITKENVWVKVGDIGDSMWWVHGQWWVAMYIKLDIVCVNNLRNVVSIKSAGVQCTWLN